jgi:hypothetical protein
MAVTLLPTARSTRVPYLSQERSRWTKIIILQIVWQLDLQVPMQSVPITTKVVSSSPVHGEVYSIKHSVTCGRSVVFSWYFGFLQQYWPSWYNWNIALNTTTIIHPICKIIIFVHLDRSCDKYVTLSVFILQKEECMVS